MSRANKIGKQVDRGTKYHISMPELLVGKMIRKCRQNDRNWRKMKRKWEMFTSFYDTSSTHVVEESAVPHNQ